jgi:membrane protease YdiL (CAAX protease family)
MTQAPAETGLPFHEIQLAGRGGRWRPVVGSLAMVAWLAIFAALVVLIPFAIWYAIRGYDVDTLLDPKHITPMNLAFTDIVLATLTPMAMVLTWRLHSIPTKWLWSVVGRIRWKFLLACLGASVVTLVAAVVVQNLVHADTGDPSSPVIPWSSTLAGFFLVIAFLTPLQATGEEFMFRGYLLQALGSLSRRVWVPVVLSGLVFGLFHGLGQSPPVFLDRFAFGLTAGYLAVRTGGLEAGIAMHLLNNWLSLSVAAATGQLDDALHPTAGSWWTLPSTLTQTFVYLALVLLIARRMDLPVRTEGRVLEAQRSRV